MEKVSRLTFVIAWTIADKLGSAHYYFLRFSFSRCLLHTVEFRGSSPLSPTTFFSATCTIPRQV